MIRETVTLSPVGCVCLYDGPEEEEQEDQPVDGVGLNSKYI